jgi:hypothetical protein
MDTDWKQDPRLKNMDKKKLDFLTGFAERLKKADKNSMMEALASVNLEARQKGIQFNDQETSLLVSIISASMAPAERKKVDMLKILAKKLAGPN